MGDYLTTIVKKCTITPLRTDMLLAMKGEKDGRIKFSLPLELRLRKGDKIDFYHGSFIKDRLGKHISHDCYARLKIYREKSEEPFLAINSRDIKILELVREEAREVASAATGTYVEELKRFLDA